MKEQLFKKQVGIKKKMEPGVCECEPCEDGISEAGGVGEWLPCFYITKIKLFKFLNAFCSLQCSRGVNL